MKYALLACSLLLDAAFVQAQAPVSLESGAWTIKVTNTPEQIVISHAAFGVLLENGHLALHDPAGTRDLHNWAARVEGPELLLKTADPESSWRFRVSGDALEISSTSFDAELLGNCPDPQDKIAARLLDRAGFPVQWTGTGEVKASYGGAMTINPSFLPRKNPDVMYFSLGPASGSHFHALFNRKSDTALDLPDGSRIGSALDTAPRELTIPVRGNALLRARPDYFTKELGVPFYTPFDDTVFHTAPMVWSSWTSYYEAVTEHDIVRNADWLAEHLKPYGFQFVQLDDGYDRDARGQHYWIENWDKQKFPHGPEWLTHYIQSKGLRAGIWLVPNAYAGAVKTHPDWYLRDRNGNLILDYSTPTLDSTNPQVLAFDRHLFETLDGWGFDYYKFDGEHAAAKYIPSVDHSKLYNPGADLIANYRDRLRIIRDTLGPNRFIEGCPAGTPLNGIGYFNSYFNGHDLYNDWQGMYPLFSSITANGFLNHLAIYIMPGEGLELEKPMTVAEAAKKRPKIVIDTERDREDPMTGFGVTDAEARTLVSYVALTGVAYPLASVMPELPPDRVELLEKTMPTLPILPMDLFSRGTDIDWPTFRHVTANDYLHNYPEILDLKVNAAAGAYDVVGVTNWRAGTLHRHLDFAGDLGLPNAASYAVFDFWNEKLIGEFKNAVDLDVSSHDTRVLLIHPLAGHPELLGTSRHISGSFSLSNVHWDPQTQTLAGISQTIPSRPYELWIYLPTGVQVAGVSAAVPVQQTVSGHLLTVRFNGTAAPVSWKIAFR
ncbi:MAG TPA: alpha-galactosidase [Bryobacteraceae bacterium]|jgi:hypothetical protein|nr:alpha-galactosidase [Bryobacteraceae bacterium]